MFLILTLGALTLVLSFLLTPIVRDRVRQFSFPVSPEGGHPSPILRAGGILISGFCVLAAAGLLIMGVLHSHLSGISMLFCAVAGVSMSRRGHTRFARARTMFLAGRFQEVIDVEARLADFERTLRAAANAKDCWAAVLQGSREFGFCGVRMRLGTIIFEDLDHLKGRAVWQLRVPLAGSQYINFYRDIGSNPNPLTLNAFVGCVKRGLGEKVWVPETDGEAGGVHLGTGPPKQVMKAV